MPPLRLPAPPRVPPSERCPALPPRGARKDLPLTSGTLFTFRKLPLQGDLAAVVVSCNGVKTRSALALSFACATLCEGRVEAGQSPRAAAEPGRKRAMLLTRREQEALPHVIQRVVRDWPDLAPVAGTASRHRGGRAGHPVLHSAARDLPAARDWLRARLGEELRAGGGAGG